MYKRVCLRYGGELRSRRGAAVILSRDQMGTDSIEARGVSLTELGIGTRVLEAGSGPVVLLLHGNPDNADRTPL
jgi:hypothetical protein